MQNWYCLTAKSELYLIGQCSNYDEADELAEKQGHEVIWIIDEQIAKQWHNVLSN
jgi:hypothetical protein